MECTNERSPSNKGCVRLLPLMLLLLMLPLLLALAMLAGLLVAIPILAAIEPNIDLDSVLF